tara:strand:- start:491 stop:1057 length:567 start_codon:yes stop_codon:yes gene_type:complete
MIKIGIIGSISSGKTTASKIISYKRGPFFSADKIVKKLYSQRSFKQLIAKKLDFNLTKNFKKDLIDKILQRKKNLKKLEKIIHPFVRKKMFAFVNNNRNKKFLFFEIPLLIENKLEKYFDIIIFIKSKKNLRLKRYLSKGGEKKLFILLNNHQLIDSKKMKFSNHIVVNNTSLSILKKNLLNIIRLYE